MIIEHPDTKVDWFIIELRRRYGVNVSKHKMILKVLGMNPVTA